MKNTEIPGPVFELVVPPTGSVKKVILVAVITGAGTIRFDAGCDNRFDCEFALEKPSGDSWPLDLTASVAPIAEKAAWRDQSARRIIPVRISADRPVTITLKNLEVIVE